jgi:hypothetical protein
VGSMGTTVVHRGACLGSYGEANTPRTQELGTMVPSLCVWRAGVWKQEIRAIGLSGPLPLKKPARASHSSVILQLSARSLCSPRARDKTKVTRGRPFFGLGSACGRLWLMGLSLGCLGLSWVCLGPVLPWDSTQIASAGPQDGSRSSKDASRWAQQGSRLAQDRFEHESWLRSWDSLGSS